MQDHENSVPVALERTPWNKGKLIGAKPPLRPKHVWSIRTKLQVGGRMRDLAMFNLAIDSKLRGCDVVALKVEDIAPHGYAVDQATVRQKKTGQPVRFEVTEHTREAVDDYIRATGKKSGEFLFGGRRNLSPSGRLRRPHSQGREACRPSGHAADEIRAGHEPQDCQGASPRNSADGARARRRGDRIKRRRYQPR